MKHLGLIGLAIGLLTIEGALARVMHLDVLRPDPILPLVIILALRPGAAGALTTFGLGLIADSFCGTPTGMLALIYLVIWGLVRMASAYLLPDRRLVQYSLLFVMSVFFYLALMGILAGVLIESASVQGPVSTLALWLLPLALLNLLVAMPVWALSRRILGARQQVGLFTAR